MDYESAYLTDLLNEIRGMGLHEAVQVLNAAATAHPTDPRPVLLLAGQFAQAREMDRAEAAYLTALQREPSFSVARFQLGLLQFTNARPITAMATWAPLDLLPEQNSLRQFKQALSCLIQNQFDEACQWLNKGILNNADNHPLNMDMQWILQRVMQAGIAPSGDLAEAGSSSEPNPLEERPVDGDASGMVVESHFLISGYQIR